MGGKFMRELIWLSQCMQVLIFACVLSGVGAAKLNVEPNGENDVRDADWIENRIAAWQPTKAERAFEEIGWAGNLTEAQSLARKHGRGLFVFTYDGASLTGYRC
jgi:hypothetical protein